MGKITEKLKNEIYPRITHQMIFSDQTIHDKGKYIVFTCPKCHKKDKFFAYHGNHFGRCNVLSCGYQISWWDYVQERYGITGVVDEEVNKKMLRKFAEIAGVYLPPDASHQSHGLKTMTVQSLQHEFLKWGRQSLFSSSSEPLLQKVLDRGLTREEIEKGTEICAMANRKAFKQHFLEQGYSEDQIKESGLGTWGFGYNYQLLFPHRNEKGQIVSWAGWLTLPGRDNEGNDLPKYKNAFGFPKDVPFNLANARNAISHSKKAILVEGFFDSIHPFAKGFRNIVSLLGNRLLPSHVHHLQSAGAEQILLCLDQDNEGEAGTEWAMELLLKHPQFKPYYIFLPPGCKDADEVLKKHGKEQVETCFASGQPAWEWYAGRLGARFDNSSDRDAQITHFGEIYNAITDPINKSEFIKELSKRTDIGILTLRKRFSADEAPETNHEQEKIREHYKRFVSNLTARWKKGMNLGVFRAEIRHALYSEEFIPRNPISIRFKELLTDLNKLTRKLNPGIISKRLEDELYHIKASRPEEHNVTTHENQHQA